MNEHQTGTTSRREFIALTAMGFAAFIVASEAGAQTFKLKPTANMNKESSIGYIDGKYVLPPLPYAYNALEPLMDEETVTLHHDKHHAAYVAGANAAADKLKEIAEGKIDASLTTAYTRNLAFHASGHALHTLFWTNMSPAPKKAPAGALAKAIDEKFGSFDNFLKVFKATAAGVEGSGWALLAYDPTSKSLVICGIEKHQNLDIPGIVPLLACDVWEHAYYLKHKNNRAGFIDSFVQLIDWADVENRYTAALS